MTAGLLWLFFGIALIFAESVTSGFILLWFGVGALCAALLAFVGIDSLSLQLLVFTLVSVLLTVASRTVLQEYIMRRSPGRDIKMGVDALPGQIGQVVSPSTGDQGEGSVKVFGSVWRALPAEGEGPLTAGESVQVERVQGLTVYVRRTSGVAPWRLSEHRD